MIKLRVKEEKLQKEERREGKTVSQEGSEKEKLW